MSTKIFDVTGKTALVTGASYGLGAAMAEALAAAGCNVVLAARSLSKLEEVARGIFEKGGSAIAVACDVAKADQVKAMVGQAWETFGRVDILVNNAGIVAGGGAVPEKVPHELFEQTIQVNVNGVWYCCREVGARMLADGKGGSIINLASILGLGSVGDLSPSYQASKAAVINLTRALASSWGDRGVRVNALAPGWFPSEMTDLLFSMPAFMDWAKGLAPLKRVGMVSELIGPLLFLASDASSFVTGHTLTVDGGFSAGSGAAGLPASVLEAFEANVPDGLGKHIVCAKTAGGD